jgi:hypothetical protein
MEIREHGPRNGSGQRGSSEPQSKISETVTATATADRAHAA